MRAIFFDDDVAAAAALQKGNVAALGYLYEKYFHLVYRFLYPYCRDQQLVEEITQDAFVRLWEKRARIDPTLNCKNLLFTIARNLLTDYLRSARHNASTSITSELPVEPATDKTYQDILLADLQKQAALAVTRLPDRSRQVYTMSRMHHLSHKEIAASLNISIKAVEKHLSVALKYLRAYCSEHLLEIAIVTGILSL